MPFILLSGSRHRDPPAAIRYPQDECSLILVAVLETDNDPPKVLLQPLCGVLGAQRVQASIHACHHHGIAIHSREILRPRAREREQLPDRNELIGLCDSGKGFRSPEEAQATTGPALITHQRINPPPRRRRTVSTAA